MCVTLLHVATPFAARQKLQGQVKSILNGTTVWSVVGGVSMYANTIHINIYEYKYLKSTHVTIHKKMHA